MAARKRSNSVKQALDQLEPVPLPVAGNHPTTTSNHPPPPPWVAPSGPLTWLVKPAKTAQVIALVLAAWATLEHLTSYTGERNPLTPFLFISYALPHEPRDGPSQRYGKGPLDLAFLAFYIVVFSFLRQSITEFLIRPLARRLGLKTQTKQARFMEQAYAFVYFSASGAFGLYVMSKQPSWWYKTEHFWLEYPHWRMDGVLKSYYLLQFLEKPRSDFKELVIHHIVTLWLVGWSYMINLTMIGTAVFVSMDLPDICLALSKCLNYLDLQHTSEVSFVFFLCVWHYMRHYLNLLILSSVWNEYDLIPAPYRSWTSDPLGHKGWWLFYGFGTGSIPRWMKYQIFAPILALQLVNTFWSYLIWRILFRMITGQKAQDVREEGEGEGEPEVDGDDVDEKKKQQ